MTGGDDHDSLNHEELDPFGVEEFRPGRKVYRLIKNLSLILSFESHDIRSLYVLRMPSEIL